MKELYEHNGVAMGVADERNYVVYDKNKPIITKDAEGKERTTYKFAYFNQIGAAIREVCRRVANEEAQDLHEWLKVYERISGLPVFKR